MMKELLMEFKKIDHSIISLMKSGIRFSFGIIVIATIILLTYDFIYTLPLVYYIGLSLFKTGLFFIVGFIIGAFAFNRIMRDLKE